ncbi:hypothetical protein [Halobacillus seohaensis]|uniref:DUF805 domain-containing protein n=1 Tax=Halobacillus seohaensis TaxID=447421 RepID=A0ABW2EPW6_9BACI
MKLNVVSILYAFMLFVPIELMLNAYRVSRLTGWNLDNLLIAMSIVVIIGFISSTMFLIFLTKKWMINRKSAFWSMLLWFPYLVIFVFIFVTLFPINNPADQPGPGGGIIILATLILYPFYLLLTNVFGTGIGLTEDEYEVK